MKVLVIGGSGLIGSQVVANLTELGHEAVSASPSSGVNTITGEGLTEAVIGVDAVVDVSNSPSWADDDVLNFFTTSTRNLLEAERAAGVRNHVALSIVGADRANESGYMRAKIAQEKLIEESGSPYTIVRATQFFEFVDGIADSLAQGDTVRAPHGAFQPIAAADVALAVTRAAAGEPVNGTINIAGPEKAGMDDFIRNRFAATGDARQVVTDPEAHYYGAVLDERMIVPLEGPDGEEVTIYPNPFSDWSATHLASGAH
ncbi:SDR family oxidoreductase [Mycobacterium sp.]|uniref:SDR family oxidoreductase n=1 Tax=Mycobacterium sp. TaxID=1785 RepID=UPI003C728B52